MKALKLRSVLDRQVVKTRYFLDKNSPEILLGLGVIGAVTATVLACKATLRIQDILERRVDQLKSIDEAAEHYKSAYSDQDKGHDILVTNIQYGAEIAREYAPAAILGAISITMFVSSNRIMARRNAALVSAYTIVSQAYKAYRTRVVEEFGPEVDKYLRLGRRDESRELRVVDQDGKDAFFEDEGKDLPGELVDDERLFGVSGYAKWFNEDSSQFRRGSSNNLFFLTVQQNYFNDKLRMNGHVFLNEVYDALGLPRTQAGAVVGWLTEEYGGDGFIDFDIHNPRNADGVNGYSEEYLLDFNVDGTIYDKI